MKSAVLVAFAMLAACYGAAPPPPPRVPLPPPAPGAEIAVFSETKTTFESVQKQASSCPAGKGEGDPSCVVTSYTATEPVTRTTTRASYGTAPINYGQFRVMTDPHYDDKVAELADLSHRCKRANIPRYLGVGLLVAGALGGSLIGGDAGRIVVYGGLAGGGASYGLGYFAFGGSDCVRAAELSSQVDMTTAMTRDSVQGAEIAVEMKTLAEQFNAAQRAAPRSAGAGSAP